MKRKRNTYPFIILLIVHSFLLLYTFIKNKDRKTLLTLLFSNIGFAYLFEYLILNLLKAYRYKPKVFKKSYLNNILGAILSQAVFIPFTALFLTAFRLNWNWKAFFILYFHIVERLFIKMKVYKTNWWNPLLTTLLLPIYFFLSDKWYELLKTGSKSVKLVSSWLANLIIEDILLFVLTVTRQIRFGKGKYFSLNEHFIYSPLYGIAISLIKTRLLLKDGYMSMIKSLIYSICLDWYLYRNKLLKTNFIFPGLNLILKGLMLFVSAGIIRMVSRDREG